MKQSQRAIHAKAARHKQIATFIYYKYISIFNITSISEEKLFHIIMSQIRHNNLKILFALNIYISN